MLYNATILRVDAPGSETPGPDINVRCALTPVTTAQAGLSVQRGWETPVVVYIPLARVPSAPAPEFDGAVLLRADGDEAETLFNILEVNQVSGRTLGHVQLYLAPAT